MKRLKSTETMRVYCIAFLLVAVHLLPTHTYCMPHLDGAKCEHIQDAGRTIANDINEFDLLVKEVLMRCFQESYLVMETSVKFFLKHLSASKVQLQQKGWENHFHFFIYFHSTTVQYLLQFNACFYVKVVILGVKTHVEVSPFTKKNVVVVSSSLLIPPCLDTIYNSSEHSALTLI